MTSPIQLSRRVLLGCATTGVAVFGTFLLPAESEAARRHRVVHGHRGTKRPVVMLDPGHGGKDPGAIGVSGTYEKHVALKAAFELHRLLEDTHRYEVRMTRASDRFIPLEERVAIAQHHGADLFVSMHADSILHHPKVRGASVYTLSAHASDALAAEIATSENSADRFEGPKFHGVTPEVARILASLVRRETRVDSVRLANRLVASLDRKVQMLDNPERHAGFVVLKSTQIPSVLVEMGFMSNRHDEAELRRPAHRAVIAGAMRDAVEAYFASRRTPAAIGGEV